MAWPQYTHTSQSNQGYSLPSHSYAIHLVPHMRCDSYAYIWYLT